jgi:calcineurin-like phosphoesterase family protein
MTNIWITSDHHFGHKAILSFTPKRCKDNGEDYKNIEEHDQDLIRKWNELVQPNDIVYYLGDFAYKCSMSYAQYIFWSLNGKKILISGNHDHKLANKFTNSWEEICQIKRIEVTKSNGGKQLLLLGHRPFLTWESKCWHFHGHTHSNIEKLNNNLKAPDHHSIQIRKDIGIDTNDGYPYNLQNLVNSYDKLYPKYPI